MNENSDSESNPDGKRNGIYSSRLPSTYNQSIVSKTIS